MFSKEQEPERGYTKRYWKWQYLSSFLFLLQKTACDGTYSFFRRQKLKQGGFVVKQIASSSMVFHTITLTQLFISSYLIRRFSDEQASCSITQIAFVVLDNIKYRYKQPIIGSVLSRDTCSIWLVLCVKEWWR